VASGRASRSEQDPRSPVPHFDDLVRSIVVEVQVALLDPLGHEDCLEDRRLEQRIERGRADDVGDEVAALATRRARR
jgi:hypothetical protein